MFRSCKIQEFENLLNMSYFSKDMFLISDVWLLSPIIQVNKCFVVLVCHDWEFSCGLCLEALLRASQFQVNVTDPISHNSDCRA